MKIYTSNIVKQIMRISTVVMLVTILCMELLAADPAKAQFLDKPVSVQFQNDDLQTAIQRLEKLDIRFAYDADLLALKSANVNNREFRVAPLKQVLQYLFMGTEIVYEEQNHNVVLKKKQQPGRIIGQVSDEEGLPLGGANLRVVETNQSFSADSDGNFSIRIAEGVYTLEVTYISYETQRKVNVSVEGQQTVSVNFTLKETESALNEVVIVGFGATKRANLTGAVESVDMEVLNERPLPDAGSMLQGASPGLNIVRSTGKLGADSRINVRGFTSINGTGPLVIIDGFEGDINNLNPEDITSISVLKDAGAAAIYGARGAFGVILVTTKQGKADAMEVNFNTSTVMSTPTINTDYITDPYLSLQLIDGAHRAATGTTFSQYTEADYAAVKEVSENPSLARVIIDNRNGRDQYIHYGHTDWWDYFHRKWSPSQFYNASVSGGTEKVKGYFSFRQFNSTGILKVQDDQLKKTNLRGNFNVQVNNWFNLSNNMHYNMSNDLEHAGDHNGFGSTNHYIQGSLHAPPFYMPVNPDGTAFYRTGLNQYVVSGNGVYPALLYGKSRQIADEGEFSNIITAHLTPVRNLNVIGSYIIRRNTFEQSQRSTKVPYSLYPGIIETVGTDRLTEYRTNSRYDGFNLHGDYSLTLNQHNLKGLVGYNQEYYKSSDLNASKQNNISDDLNALNLANDNPINNGAAGEWALRGLFYRLNYDFANKYLVELNGRYDGSSRFPSDSRWGFFPSVSAGWLINQEEWFDKWSSTISLFKLRASYGTLGNQNIGNYAYFPTLAKSVNSGFAMNGANLEYMTSPALSTSNISWEKVTTTNLGVDMAFLRNRFNISFDWFERNTEDMLTQSATRPYVLGANSPLANAADMQTRGFELSLGYNQTFQVANSPLHFSVSGNLSNTESIITRFDNPSMSLLNYYEGMRIGEIWGYHIEGLFQSAEEIANHANQQQVASRQISTGGLQPGDVKYFDADNNGKISPGANTLNDPGDRSIIGNSTPQYLYSFKLDASWKGLDLSAFFQGVGKQDWYPHGEARQFWGMYSWAYNSYIRKDIVDDIWTPENTDAYFPRLWGYIAVNGNATLSTINDRYMQDISYLRLKNLTIGYTLPKSVTGKWGIDRVRVYFSGENLLTFAGITNYIDPEAASSTVNFNQAPTTQFRSAALLVPFTANYSFGLSLKF